MPDYTKNILMIRYNTSMNKLLQHLFLGILTAFLFSGFIYFEYYHLTNKFLNTLFGLGALALLLYIPKRSILIAGFFIGILWFYWIGYSFQYQGVYGIAWYVTFGFGVIYILFFAPLAFTNEPIIRAVLLFILSFIAPFDFNWLKIELLFVNSYIGIEKYQLFIILLSLSVVHYIKDTKYKYLPLILLLLTLNINPKPQPLAPLRIKLVQTHIKQEDKWRPNYLDTTLQIIFSHIHNAINEGYDVVVLPESVFPLYMNQNPTILQALQALSHQITIVAGSLITKHHKHYNVTYMFENGKYHIAKKVVLVPFGEYIPLPSPLKEYINQKFFAGASDFIKAKQPTDFIIKGIKFRNAICYEATTQELYEGDVKYMIAISNNGWFVPSIEPTLQKLLLKFYAHKNHVTIYHSANMAGTGVIF